MQGLHKEDFVYSTCDSTSDHLPKKIAKYQIYNTHHILHFELTGADDVSTSGVDDLSYVDDISCVEDVSCVDDSTPVLMTSLPLCYRSKFSQLILPRKGH